MYVLGAHPSPRHQSAPASSDLGQPSQTIGKASKIQADELIKLLFAFAASWSVVIRSILLSSECKSLGDR